MSIHFPVMPERLTKYEARILDYISHNPDAFLFSSIGRLAQSLEMSEATVSRFVRRVGCRDFKDLKQLVMRQVTEESGGPAAKLAGTLSRQTDFTAAGWLRLQQQYLEKTLEELDETAFQEAVRAVRDARRIFIHAKSASASLGQLLRFRLRRLGLEVQLLPSGGSEVLEGLAQAGKGDLVILFSLSKVSREGRMILDYRKKAGYQTLAFCSRSFIPEEERADIQLFAYRGETREYHSMAAPAALADGLVVEVSRQMGAASAQALSRLHQLKKQYDPDR